MRQRWCIALRLPVQLRANNQDDEVVFTFNLDNDMKKKRLTVKSENKDIHFKLEDIN